MTLNQGISAVGLSMISIYSMNILPLLLVYGNLSPDPTWWFKTLLWGCFFISREAQGCGNLTADILAIKIAVLGHPVPYSWTNPTRRTSASFLVKGDGLNNCFNQLSYLLMPPHLVHVWTHYLLEITCGTVKVRWIWGISQALGWPSHFRSAEWWLVPPIFHIKYLQVGS